MAEVTTKEMIALLNADIKFALEIGDKEFVGYLKEAKGESCWTLSIPHAMKSMMNSVVWSNKTC